jgi:hypothetical protein
MSTHVLFTSSPYKLGVAEQVATHTLTLGSAKDPGGHANIHILVVFSAYSPYGHTSTHLLVLLLP